MDGQFLLDAMRFVGAGLAMISADFFKFLKNGSKTK